MIIHDTAARLIRE